MPLALAIDLGGTKVEAALVDETGALVEGGAPVDHQPSDEAGGDRREDACLEGEPGEGVGMGESSDQYQRLLQAHEHAENPR